MKILALPLLFLANFCLAQVSFVEKKHAQDFKNAAQTVVILASEDAKTLKKISKKKAADYAALYKKMVADYNANLREVFGKNWKFNRVSFMTRQEFAAKADAPNTFFIATGLSDEMLADAARTTAKKKRKEFDLDNFLVSHDEASSLDICPGSQFSAYFSSKLEWEQRQKLRMEQDRQMGKNAQAGDYLKHRQLDFVGFYLSQHALLTKSDLRFGLHFLQNDLETAVAGGKKAEVNKTPALSGAKLSGKTLLVGRDLTVFPTGKTNLSDAEIKAAFPNDFRVVGQSEIEKALEAKNPNVAVVVPSVRWSVAGYPELLLFYVVDASDGLSIVTFADTGSGQNAMTANQFERSQELKAKHFQEFLSNME